MKIKALVMALAVVVGTTTSAHATDDQVDQAEIDRLGALIESFNRFFDEQLRLAREQEILDTESRVLLLESEKAHRELIGEDEASTNSFCDPGTLCRASSNTANITRSPRSATSSSARKSTNDKHEKGDARRKREREHKRQRQGG